MIMLMNSCATFLPLGKSLTCNTQYLLSFVSDFAAEIQTEKV